MRVLVTGGRDYADWRTLNRVLEAWHNRSPGIAVLIHGCAPGADTLAGEWAQANGVPVERYGVNHHLDGEWPAAGPRRNARMLRDGRPDVVLAFPRATGQIGEGTADMMRRARAAGVRVVEPIQERVPGLFSRPVS